MKLTLENFGGEMPARHPKLLPAAAAAVSLNHKPSRGDLRPWRAASTVATIASGRKSIYRMGRDTVSDTNYWLSWTTPTHVVRASNSGDTAERTYFTGAGTPKWTDTTRALGADPPVASRELGVPAPMTAPTLSASGGASTSTEVRVYVYTYVNDIGWESAPSPAATITCKLDATVTLSAMAPAPSGNYGITGTRVYRSQGTSAGGSLFYVRDADLSGSTTDATLPTGEALETSGWLPAPGIPQGGSANLTESNLFGLTAMWNDMLAGICGRGVRVCEAGVPYAWPFAYEVAPADYSPVALGVFGQTLVVLTNGNPTIITGGSPDALDEQPLDFLQACVSPQSVVSMGHGVAWASPDGLAYVGSGGAKLLTDGVMTREDWQALKPETIVGCVYERSYYGFYQPSVGTKRGFVIDPADPSGIRFLDFGCDAVFVDDLQDMMYLLNGASIQKWDAGSALTTTWRSKLLQMPRTTPALTCATVVADAYPVTFRIFADGSLKHTQTVANSDVFFLPGGYHADTFQFEIVTNVPVQQVAIAHSPMELRAP